MKALVILSIVAFAGVAQADTASCTASLVRDTSSSHISVVLARGNNQLVSFEIQDESSASVARDTLNYACGEKTVVKPIESNPFLNCGADIILDTYSSSWNSPYYAITLSKGDYSPTAIVAIKLRYEDAKNRLRALESICLLRRAE